MPKPADLSVISVVPPRPFLRARTPIPAQGTLWFRGRTRHDRRRSSTVTRLWLGARREQRTLPRVL